VTIIDPSRATGGRRFAVVVARFNDFVTDRLQRGAIDALKAAGAADADLTVIRVPGAFEIPTAARLAAETGHFAAIVCLGCLIRGETPHFEYISSAVAHGLTDAAGDTAVPMTFGVLTTNSAEEALARAGEGPSNKGWEAAVAAIEMADLAATLQAMPAARGPEPLE
jgi:6,7-dimethyl-8-ribityllumazine synthase